MTITKSDLIDFMTCRKYLWLKNHASDRVKRERGEIDEFMTQQGYAVEALARQVFEDVPGVQFQVAATAGDFYARADIVTPGPDGSIILNEVKSSKNKDEDDDSDAKKAKEQSLNDVTIQRIIFERAGHKVHQVNLVLLNRDYVRQGAIDPHQLIVVVDVTAEIDARREKIEAEMQKALDVVALASEPEHLVLRPCCKFRDCLCVDACFKDLPEYPIYELNRVTSSKKKLPTLEDAGIFDIRTIPDDFELTERQHNQVLTARSGQAMIDKPAIAAELGKLEYPLYFVDYETFSPAIPLYDGFKPFEHITFQYSLYVLDAPGAEPKHFEFLATENKDPTQDFLTHLKSHIGPKGHVLVWNKTFEVARNKDMATRAPEFASFLMDINARVYDLKDIFEKQLYVHPAFRGRTSIKQVLPVLVPALSHADLDISEGETASVRWYNMIAGKLDPKTTQANLLEYCKLDTWAMVEIHRVLTG